MKKTTLFFLFLILVRSGILLAQDDLPLPTIQLKAGVVDREIRLRWAVDQPVAWTRANAIGFVLKRYTVRRNGELLKQPEEKILGKQIRRPEQEWEQIVDDNDYAGIIAQALFGDRFEVDLNEEDEFLSLINQAQELEQRFSFALMAADLDFGAASYAGWGYVDSTAQADETYLYRVELDQENNPNALAVEDGNTLASLSDYAALPKPQDFVGIFKDHHAVLTWETLQFEDIYTAYFVERATEGTDFIQLSDVPTVMIDQNAEHPTRGIVYTDSLPQNDKTYSYRIRGKTIFGEYGPYSTVVSGEGLTEVGEAPVIMRTSYTEESNEVVIEWDFPKEEEENITGFDLLYSPNDSDRSYNRIAENIAPAIREITTQSFSPANYFKVQAVGKDGSRSSSFSTLVQPLDSIPPDRPTGLEGQIDTTGVVRLKWDSNTEADLQGYHVFRTQQEGAELVRITPQLLTEPEFTDTVQVKSLTRQVYYYVTALDNRYNQSEPSEILRLEKPDILQPPTTSFLSYRIEEEGITLNWLKIDHDAIAAYQLYRAEIDRDNFEKIIEIQELDKDTLSFTDTKVTPDNTYRYYLKTTAKNGRQSEASPVITLTPVSFDTGKALTNLTIQKNVAKKQIELLWRVRANNVTEILVYRAKNDEKPKMFRSLYGEQNHVEDDAVKVGNTYTYYLKALLNNNRPSPTESISIDY